MNLLAVLFLLVGLFSLGYTVAIVSYSGMNTAFLWFWVTACLGCFILFVLLRLMITYKIELGKHVKFGLTFITLFGIAFFMLVEGIIIYNGRKQPGPGADYVIVLGAQVRGTALSRALRNRLDTAYEYLADNESSRIIVSGGQGDGEDISEAEAMYRYLITKGIKAERILKEDQSVNTYENILFSKALMAEGNHNVVIVTSRFHIFRALGISKKLGLGGAEGLGAPADDILVLNYYVREFFAVMKDKLAGNI